MPDTITWTRPSGSTITTSSSVESVKLAAKAGWEPKKSKPAPAKKTAKKSD